MIELPAVRMDSGAALAAIRSEFASVTDFEREFPSVCFALATGVGKTRLMGVFISYLHLAHGINNFFVLAPNLTIYNKLITDFTPNTPKYVFKGISEFATDAPAIITGDNYESMAGTLFDEQLRCKVNIFNIPKINSEVRGGKSPRIKRLSEYYIRDFDVVSQRVHHCLVAGGVFVFPVEHPIVTALAAQQWCPGPNGERLHWPADQYQEEGPRHTQWMADDVIKYHRTVGSYVNTLIESGFRISKLAEPLPLPEKLTDRPDLQDERRRPSLLFIAAASDPIP